MRYLMPLVLMFASCELESVETTEAEAEPMRMRWIDSTGISYDSMADLATALTAEVDVPSGSEVRLVPWGSGRLSDAEIETHQRKYLPPEVLAVLEAAEAKYPPVEKGGEEVLFTCTEKDVQMPTGGVTRPFAADTEDGTARCTTWPMGRGPSPREIEDLLMGRAP